jgi:molybdopterin converting factor small subunit
LLDARAGAYAGFEGWVRNVNEGRAVDALTYEAYAALAEAEGERILAEAVANFAIVDAACVHRTGRLALGELAVWVGVSAGHRDAAGRASEVVPLPASLGALYEELRARHGFALAPERLRVAVDGAFADWHAPLRDGAEVAFIPPVSGG